MNKNQTAILEFVCTAVSDARASLEELIDDTDWSEKEDQEDILLGMLDNLQAVDSQFDAYKDEWELYVQSIDVKNRALNRSKENSK